MEAAFAPYDLLAPATAASTPSAITSPTANRLFTSPPESPLPSPHANRYETIERWGPRLERRDARARGHRRRDRRRRHEDRRRPRGRHERPDPRPTGGPDPT